MSRSVSKVHKAMCHVAAELFLGQHVSPHMHACGRPLSVPNFPPALESFGNFPNSLLNFLLLVEVDPRVWLRQPDPAANGILCDCQFVSQGPARSCDLYICTPLCPQWSITSCIVANAVKFTFHDSQTFPQSAVLRFSLQQWHQELLCLIQWI